MNSRINNTNIAEIATLLQTRFAELKQSQGLTKTTLAKNMGTSRAHINRLLQPHIYNVSVVSLGRLARLLGFSHVKYMLV
jgi:transcriptional regulator with XRE-family HTH domain